MNIMKAIESGLPFRRKEFEPDWYIWVEQRRLVGGFYPTIGMCVNLNLYDLQAEWTLRPDLLTINYDQFYECLNSDGINPNSDGGVAIDVRAAWRILRRIVDGSQG